MAENRREEQKLWLILFQIRAIRTRLNLLAIQYWLFGTCAVLIGATALIFGAAVVLGPLLFLTLASLTCLGAIVALIGTVRRALRRAADPARAAALADSRAGLQGRLATVLALAPTPPASPLWPYLLEDTYALRHRFEPSAVEPRWISRAILAPLAALLMAAALFLATQAHRRTANTAAGGPLGEMTADLGNLEIQPADPSQPANARVYADPATMRQLLAKLAQAKRPATDPAGVARWMNKARQLAGSLQNQVTGAKPGTLPPLALRLRDAQPAQPGSDSGPAPRAGDGQANSGANGPINPPGAPGDAPATGGAMPPPVHVSPDDANRLAQNGLPAQPGALPSDSSAGALEDHAGPKVGSGYADEAGSNHSAGADPEHLFGPPAADPLGSDSFKLSVDARPIDESSSGGAPAYLPPKVRVPLNPQQLPDEPLARTNVPFDDRQTIKRVFER